MEGTPAEAVAMSSVCGQAALKSITKSEGSCKKSIYSCFSFDNTSGAGPIYLGPLII